MTDLGGSSGRVYIRKVQRRFREGSEKVQRRFREGSERVRRGFREGSEGGQKSAKGFRWALTLLNLSEPF
jgi:hypothetical protein